MAPPLDLRRGARWARGPAALAVVVAVSLTGCTGAPAPDAPVAPPAVAASAPLGTEVEPVPASDPEGLARQIALAENTIADRARPREEVEAAGRMTQVAYGVLADHPEWDVAVTAGLPPRVAAAARRTVDARRLLLEVNGPAPATTLPAWRITAPWPPEQLRAWYDEAARRFGVPWTVLAAVNLVETQMGRIAASSVAGAQGPMQFMPATWADYGLGGDVWKPRDAILGAANHLRSNGAARGTDAGLDRALYRYNNDVRYVRAVRHYAALMQADDRAFLGFHAWRVQARTVAGTVTLPVGYDEARPVPVGAWLARGAAGATGTAPPRR